MYLVDTNVISEVRKRDRADAGVKTFFRKAAQDDVDLYLSVVTIGQLRRGVEIIRHRGDDAQATRLGKWLDGVLSEFGQRILDVDAEIWQLWGRLRVPHPEHALYKLIAATALIHDLIVVTRNVENFADTGARVLNPFSG
ncbi:type II toxin-antitoxin system VapC family toxin [Paraburkholderia strydomiana]|uniref:type II toxin-antitoxin system VapC family toxin n=1 Tax=Paraburkholderia strydomiana TaxID=1245417 RepID=UPI001BEA9C4C|nr:type II toxin-antitoxin system VapC family toxin [Paraburkholderia strydomiana]MBT2790411.1 type II toxin-antitoxin system VapC family toxin [Paraburkholderia strydomiana]